MSSWTENDWHLTAAGPVEGNGISQGVSLKSPAQWGAVIRALFAQRRTSTLELAKVVYTAKRKLVYGQWTSMWRSGHLPFSKRKGEMLVVIGKELAWLDAQHCAHLPSESRILYYLARLGHKL